MNSPLKKFSAGAIQVAVWENNGSEGKVFQSVSIDRRYKDKKGEWKSTHSLKPSDVPKAIVALQKAYEFVVLKETGAEVQIAE
ncbi:MAG: hypothetical protein V1494_06450 [Candidatus Diapherotrites archaeon]